MRIQLGLPVEFYDAVLREDHATTDRDGSPPVQRTRTPLAGARPSGAAVLIQDEQASISQRVQAAGRVATDTDALAVAR